jgi:molybdopterin-dependent oxidoreductase alpha subunit
MSEETRAGVNAQPPADTQGLEIGEPSHSAGGWPAVKAAMAHSLSQMGASRTVKTLLAVNQQQGFDCPGCAWPDPPGRRSTFEFCENGAKAVAEEATTARIDDAFFEEWPIDKLSRQSDMWLGKQGRLTIPVVLQPGDSHYRPISWDSAFSLIAKELNALDSPDAAAFYTSGRTSNEAAFLYQLFVRQFGTNNMPDCSNMCHESSGAALSETIGVGKGTVSLKDFELCDAIIVIGQNPGTNHPRMLTTLQAAARRGAKIVSINPLREPGLVRFKHPQQVGGILGAGTPLADLFVPVRINGDVALLQGIAKELLDIDGAIDHAFIDEHTTGFDTYAAHIRAQSWDEIVEISRVDRAQIRQVAEILAASKATIFCWAMGLTQHKNAVGNIQEIVNLLLMRGSIGRPGAGACPVRGHSNVQGDRTMGITHLPAPAFSQKLAREFCFEPPTGHGLDVVEAIRAMRDGKVKVLVGLGGNFLSASPDTEVTAAALRRCNLTVQISTKLNRSHLVTGRTALILPCLGRTEIDLQSGAPQFVTVEDSMSMVHMSRGSLPPASTELRSEPWIVANLAKTVLGSRSGVDWHALATNYDTIRDHIANVVPGCEDYNRRVRQPDGFLLPNGARDRDFKTKTGKANFTIHSLPAQDLADGELMLMTIRSHDQYNTTIYGLEDRYRGVHNGRRVILMNGADIEAHGLKAGDFVDLVGRQDTVERIAIKFAVTPYDIPSRCAGAYFPEANVLVPLDRVADKSNTPASKSIPITLRRHLGQT